MQGAMQVPLALPRVWTTWPASQSCQPRRVVDMNRKGRFQSRMSFVHMCPHYFWLPLEMYRSVLSIKVRAVSCAGQYDPSTLDYSPCVVSNLSTAIVSLYISLLLKLLCIGKDTLYLYKLINKNRKRNTSFVFLASATLYNSIDFLA